MRDRIKELRRVPASSIKANPKNWRTHPAHQVSAMTQVLESIGIADASIAYEDANGELVYIDGHMRQEILGDELVPVLVLDVTEQEADELLLTIDPLASMAGVDAGAMESLITSLQFESDLADLIGQIGEDYGLSLYFSDDSGPDAASDYALVKYEIMVAKSENTTDLHHAIENLASTFGVNFRVLGTD